MDLPHIYAQWKSSAVLLIIMSIILSDKYCETKRW